MRRLRVAILGGGGILSAHLEGFRAVADRCEIVAVTEASPSRDDFLRKAIGPDVAIVRDYREAIARADVEAVDILLPHHLHMPATVAAAQALEAVYRLRGGVRMVGPLADSITTNDIFGNVGGGHSAGGGTEPIPPGGRRLQVGSPGRRSCVTISPGRVVAPGQSLRPG